MKKYGPGLKTNETHMTSIILPLNSSRTSYPYGDSQNHLDDINQIVGMSPIQETDGANRMTPAMDYAWNRR